MAENVDPALRSEFAEALPELSVPWEAARPDHPSLVVLGEELASEIGLEPGWLRSDEGVRFLLGNELAPGSAPVAQAYAGHQFGGYSPRLGDGRALLLGEIADSSGALHDLHLKGSGPTPFSRGDGFAALGPMLRELLMGEAMHALGIPTTRALAVVATGRRVMRDEGFSTPPGAVLVRVASSHLRVGSFEYALSTGDTGLLRRLADFAIERHYPWLATSEVRYRGLLREVLAAQARLVASWVLVGFVHGVMNTDNTTISGETIDYGPCAFVDAFDPATVFSSIDSGGRYAYGRQPNVVLWNLTRFAETLLPLLVGEPNGSEEPNGSDEPAAAGEASVEEAKRIALAELEGFGALYDAAWRRGMRAKLGLAGNDDLDDETLSRLAGSLLSDLGEHRIDYTSAFRALAEAARGDEEPFRTAFGEADPGEWFDSWLELRPDADAMDRTNPMYIPRNHLVDEALAAAEEGELSEFETLLEAVTRPFDAREGFERFERPAPGSRRHVTYCGT